MDRDKKINTILRIVTGAFLIGIVVLAISVRKFDTRWFNILSYVFCVIGTIEIIVALANRISFLQRSIIFAYALTFVPIYVFVGLNAALVLSFVAMAFCLFTLVFEFEKTSLEAVGLSFFGLFYPTLALLPLLLINDLGANSFVALVLVFVINPIADTFAYATGSIIGGRKFSPKISPKKTVSGAIGGIVGGAFGAILVWLVYGKGSIAPNNVVAEVLVYIIIGLIGAVVSELGDLVEGAIKRKLEIKDMGKILPGHGGLLDRIDSIIVGAMFIYLIFMFLR